MQLEFFDVPSPCVSICETDEKGLCRGCMRSRNERQEWISFTNDEKQKVIKRCLQRKKRKLNQQKEKQPEQVVESLLEENLQPSLLDPPSQTKPNLKAELGQNSDLDFSDFEL
ncbi:DUF1289 domain-containing protein [Colwellia psychrerythraea]|uniref:DUF1289 domain-containing protein n=1 Tax=Colwellia psychrerythraea TaxID=28229 RepID=A0A099KGE2_COLPS|nr:DUF1289 domain-containing protein [Colwellia psychrerythraea]KGJ89062.1 protein of unknown function DUF1289 [Colwellia psychrerythraea]